MIKRTKWIERKFDFNLPAGVFPSILERLRGTPARLGEIVKSLSDEVLTKQINIRWSIQENIGHLFDLESLNEARIDDFLTGAEILKAADIKNRKTYESDYNNKPINAILDSFRKSRMNFVSRLEELDEEILSRTSIHPRLNKPISIVNLAFFISEHDDHHIASITEIKKALIKIR